VVKIFNLTLESGEISYPHGQLKENLFLPLFNTNFITDLTMVILLLPVDYDISTLMVILLLPVDYDISTLMVILLLPVDYDISTLMVIKFLNINYL
jgi:hypothetical protein